MNKLYLIPRLCMLQVRIICIRYALLQKSGSMIRIGSPSSAYILGYETSTSALSFLMYELAKNQNAQSKLRSEILTISKNSGKEEVTYEDLSKMKYADMCITGKK